MHYPCALLTFTGLGIAMIFQSKNFGKKNLQNTKSAQSALYFITKLLYLTTISEDNLNLEWLLLLSITCAARALKTQAAHSLRQACFFTQILYNYLI